MGRHRTIDDNQLLEIARQVFRERGHTATTRDVARAAGISQSVLYQRFPTKDDLFFAAMLPPPPNLQALLGHEDEAQQGVERHLSGIALRLLAYFESVAPAILRVVTHPSFDPSAIAHAHGHILAEQLVEGFAGRIRALQQRGFVAPVDAQATAEAFVAAIHSIAMFHVFSGTSLGQVDRDRIQSFVQVFWQGLMPRFASQSSEGSPKERLEDALDQPASDRVGSGE